MDLTKLDVQEGAERGAFLHLMHPTTFEPLYHGDDEQTKEPVGIWMLGHDAKEVQKAEHRVTNTRYKRAVKTGGRIIRTSEMTDHEQLEVLVVATIRFQHIDLGEGEIEHSEKTARDLFSSHRWVREQADDFVTDRSHFLGNSSPSSSTSPRSTSASTSPEVAVPEAETLPSPIT